MKLFPVPTMSVGKVIRAKKLHHGVLQSQVFCVVYAACSLVLGYLLGSGVFLRGKNLARARSNNFRTNDDCDTKRC